MQQKALKQKVTQALAQLSPGQEGLLRAIFGIGIPAYSPHDIADKLKLSPVNIRRAQHAALRALRSPLATVH